MTQQAELMNKIDKIPQKYFGEVIDFLGYLQHKAQQEENDSQNEQKADENAVSLSVGSNGKFLLTKEKIEEMWQKSPLTRSLSGILSGIEMEDDDLDKFRMARLAKHL